MNKGTFTLDLSFADMRRIADMVHDQWTSEDYYARKTDEEVADKTNDDGDVTDNTWLRNHRAKAIAKCDDLSNLHYRLTGEYLIRE